MAVYLCWSLPASPQYNNTFSRKSESFRTLTNSSQQLLPQLIIRLIYRQVQLVETRVSTRQPICTPIIPVYLELLSTIHTCKRPDLVNNQSELVI